MKGLLPKEGAVVATPANVDDLTQGHALRHRPSRQARKRTHHRIRHNRKVQLRFVQFLVEENTMHASYKAGFATLIAATWLGLATPATAAEHAHQHVHDTSAAAPAPKPGQKWATDDTLRRGMEAIRQTMAPRQEEIDKGRLGSKDYRQMGVAVHKSIVEVVSRCKLPKDADAALHSIVLGDLVQGAELMQKSPKVDAQRAAALGVLQALRNYGTYFQHPGWSLGPARDH